MKKYRFGTGKVPWYRRGSFLYFVLAWNAMGVAGYSFYTTRLKHEDPDWKNLNYTQQYMKLYYGKEPDKHVTCTKYQGFGKVSEEVKTIEEIITPVSGSLKDAEQ